VVSLEPRDELFESRVVLELQSVPKSPLSVVEFVLFDSYRLRKSEERQGEVDETVLVVI
jgi:hypothetical protein